MNKIYFIFVVGIVIIPMTSFLIVNDVNEAKNYTTDNIVVEAQDGCETNLFNFTTIENFGQTLYAIDSADLDNDQDEDFVIGYRLEHSYSAKLSILYMNDMSYEKEDLFLGSCQIYDVCLDDFDGDADYDIIYTYSTSDGTYFKDSWAALMINEGNNSFSDPTIIFCHENEPADMNGRLHPKIVSGDFNNDGDIDFVVGDRSGIVELYLNEGNASFYPEGLFNDLGFASIGLDTADFNGDGFLDLLIASGYGIYNSTGRVLLLLNGGPDSLFTNSTEIFISSTTLDYNLPVLTEPSVAGCIQILDYNLDGKQDFLFCPNDLMGIFINQGDYSFKPVFVCKIPGRFINTEESWIEILFWGDIHCTDINDDGYEDIIMGGVQGFLRFGMNLHNNVNIIKPYYATLYIFNQPKWSLYDWDDRNIIGGINVTVENLTQIDHVDFFINGKLRHTDSEPPYTWNWRSFRFGKCTLTVKGYNEAGEYLGEHSVKVLKIL